MLDKTPPTPEVRRWPIAAAFILVMIAAMLVAVVPLMSAQVAPPPALRVPDAPAPTKVQPPRVVHRVRAVKVSKPIYVQRALS